MSLRSAASTLEWHCPLGDAQPLSSAPTSTQRGARSVALLTLLQSGVRSAIRDSTLNGSSALLLLHRLSVDKSSSSVLFEARSAGQGEVSLGAAEGGDPCAGFMTHD